MLRRSVLGNLHQGNSMFIFAGAQCTSIAFFALASVFLNMHHHGHVTVYSNNWNPENVDDIILNGNMLYDNIIYERGMQPFTFLSHTDLPSHLPVYGYELNSSVYYDMIYGSVASYSHQNAFGDVSLFDGLHTSFQILYLALLTV